jgi:hypothetical protein
LKDNEKDNADNKDSISSTLTSDHVCAHCGGVGGAIGGPGQTWTIGGRDDVWLHRGCESAYHDAHAGDPPPAEPPEDGPPW